MVAGGWERPGSEKYRFLFKILFKSIDFECRGRWEQAAGSGRDRKSIAFYLKSFSRVSILSAGAGGSRRLGAAGIGKVSFFYSKSFSKVSILKPGPVGGPSLSPPAQLASSLPLLSLSLSLSLSSLFLVAVAI